MRLRITSRLVTLSTASLIAPVLIALPAPGHAQPAPQPVPARTTHAPLLAPSAAAVGDAAALPAVSGLRNAGSARPKGALGVSGSAGSRAVRVLAASAPRPVTTEVAVIGLTWAQGTGGAAQVQYRTRARRTWGAWQAIDVDADRGESPASSTAAPPSAAAAKGTATQRAGTDPIVVTGVNAVQARVLGPAEGAPAQAQLSVIDPGSSDADAGAGALGVGVAVAGAARPGVITRAAWGAKESYRRSGPTYGAVKGVIVHHTAGSNAYTRAQVAAVMRGIYAFHTMDRKWNDIGYNFLVDKWGRIWEGRAGGLDRAVVGAHTLGYNGYTMGISMMGDYGKARPSTAALDAVARIIAWKSGIHGFSPTGSVKLYGKVQRTVMGHRNVNLTSCPGAYLYAKLPWIRSRAASFAGYTPALSLRRDVDHRGGSDVLAKTDAGVLKILSATGRGTMTAPRTLGPSGWASFDAVLAAGDFDSDGDDDIIARHAPTGRLMLFASNSRGGFSRARVIGVGFGGFSRFAAPGDFTGDGRADLLATTTSGNLVLYPGNGRGGFTRGVVVSGGMSDVKALAGVGDWDGDKRPDVIAVRSNGSAFQIRGTGRGGVLAAVSLSGDFAAYQSVTGVSDSDGDGRTELFATDSGNSTWLGRRTGVTTVSWSPAGPEVSGMTVFSG